TTDNKAVHHSCDLPPRSVHVSVLRLRVAASPRALAMREVVCGAEARLLPLPAAEGTTATASFLMLVRGRSPTPLRLHPVCSFTRRRSTASSRCAMNSSDSHNEKVCSIFSTIEQTHVATFHTSISSFSSSIA